MDLLNMHLGNLLLPEPAMVWGIFTRCLGLVYAIAIAQLYWQVIPLAGKQGINPVHLKLQQIRRDYPPAKRWLLFPTLLWIHASDRMLKCLVIIGTVSALLVIYGGAFGFPALLICWMVYLSLDIAVGLSYPWDCVLFETGFLALFLPPLTALPEIGMKYLPHPLLIWAFHLLLFRLIFGFGKFKFWKANLLDQGYFRSFMVNIPLPAISAWWLLKWPSWFFLAVLYLTLLVEIILPPFLLVGGVPGLTAAIAVTGLMLAIWLVSNFGFFNLVTILLCVPFLDTQATCFDAKAYQSFSWLQHAFIGLVVTLVTVGGLLNFLFNSWCTFTWLHWPSALQVSAGWMRGLLAFYRSILRFRIIHSFGVFPKDSTPPIKWVPVFEGSNDGKHWELYEYRFLITHEYSKPCNIAPYHPRLDHGVFYDAYGTNDANFSWSLIGGGVPYEFTHTTGMESIMQRLLEGNKAVLKLFGKVPFNADHPPKFMRIYFYRFQPVSWAEHQQTGKWWHRKPVGIHIPIRTRNDQYFTHKQITPELFHWDAVFWKDQSPVIQQLQRTAFTQDINAIYAAAIAQQTFHIDQFWDAFLPMVAADQQNWQQLPAIRQQMLLQYHPTMLMMMELVWSRLSLQLEILLRPYFLQRKEPVLQIDNYFVFGLFIHHIISKGKDAYAYCIKHPALANKYLADFDAFRAFYGYAVFWYDTLVFQSRKIRLAKRMGTLENQPVLPGFVRMLEPLSEQFIDPAEEQWPDMYKNTRNGEWTVKDPLPILHPIIDPITA